MAMDAVEQTSDAASYQMALLTEFRPRHVEIARKTTLFEGTVSSLKLGKVKLTRSYANSGLTCYWDPVPKTKAPDFYRIQIQEQGETRYQFRRGEAHCLPNSVLLIEGDSEVVAEQPAEARGMHVVLPRALLEAQLRNNGLDCFRPISTTDGSARILCEIANEILRQGPSLSPIAEAAFVSSLIWMVSAVFSANKENAQERSAAGIQFERIVRSIERNYSDPEYSIRVAAADLNISPRYIQLVLRHFETSFSALLLRRRLVASQDLLAHLPLKSNPVTEAAFSSGFSDLSHFSRSFSKAFGISPKAYRDLSINSKS